jgi:hypothetical protein
MLAARNPAILDDLRFALNVLQESSNLGLDAQYTRKLVSVIQQQIEMGAAALNRPPSLALAEKAA